MAEEAAIILIWWIIPGALSALALYVMTPRVLRVVMKFPMNLLGYLLGGLLDWGRLWR